MKKTIIACLHTAALLLAAFALPASAGVPIQHWTTAQGTRVYFVESHTLPLVDLQVDLAAGSARAPAEKPDVASFTRALLPLGAGALDENQIANQLADLGAQLGGSSDADRSNLSLRSLSAAEQLEPALALVRTLLGQPRFDEKVLERERERSIAGLKDALTRPETQLSRAFWGKVYSGHPYGRLSTPEGLASISSADLRAFWQQNYIAQRASITLVGDLSRAQAERIANELAAALPQGQATATAALPAPAPTTASTVRIAHPASQSHIALGLPAIPRGHPDFFPLMVGNYALGGGGFVSRLTKEVRDARGYAYSVYSYFSPMQAGGPFQIGLQTKREQSEAALKVVNQVLADFLRTGPTASEIKAAKDNIVGGFPLRLDSNRKLLEQVAVIGFYGLPLDWLDTYTDRINKVTAADIRAAFARWVDPARLVTVIVAGDESASAAKDSQAQ